jgi:capsule polysaccharide modification protein KpsS
MMIEDVINKGRMPLFVSEGSSKEKLKTIEQSNYLSFCYENLEMSKNKIVVFGSSLSFQDTHIAKAINHKKNKRELAIAIHIGDKHKNDLEKEIKRLKEKFRSHTTYFLDSRTIFEF